MEKITITLNGSNVEGREGMTILELAEENGVYIPTLCHNPHLKPIGACRVCLVEDERSNNLIVSCATPIEHGMVINTESGKVIEARRTVVKLMLAGHPDTCIVCDKGNACELRRIASELRIGYIEFDRVRNYHPIESSNPFIERDISKCIMCGKCIRSCQEIEVIGAIDYAYRGFKIKPATMLDLPLEKSICEFCGLCVTMCPVDALKDKFNKYKGRERESIHTICPYCGVGCNISLNVRDEKIVSVSASGGESLNNISLCVRGRYGYDFIDSPERLKTPLIREEGGFRKATWDEALGLVANKLSWIKGEYGSHVIGGIGSYRCTNEENYLFQKFFRTALRSNNIDNPTLSKVSPVLDVMERSLGIRALVTNSIEEIEDSEVILLLGSDITESHPIVGQKVKRAVRMNGAKLIIVGPMDRKLARFTHSHLSQIKSLGDRKDRDNTYVAIIDSLINVIINEELYDKVFLMRTEGFEDLKGHIPQYPEEITGLLQKEISQAARLYTEAKRALIITKPTNIEIVCSLVNLTLLTGNIGKKGSGIYILLPHNNLQGASDMGIMPWGLPGYQRLSEPWIKRFEREWRIKLPENKGLSAFEMLRASKEKRIRGMYIVGDNTVLSYHDKGFVIDSLRSLDFLVVQDIFMNETAELAHVVLPGASFAEKDGTFTNTDRRIQRVRKAIEPIGEASPDWKIITELSTMLGYPMRYKSPEEIMEEIALMTPIYGGVSYDRLEDNALHWPCPDKRHPGTRFISEGPFRFIVGSIVPELSDVEDPLLYNPGTLEKRSAGLSYVTERRASQWK